MIHLEHVCAGYARWPGRRATVLRDLSWEVPAGRRTVLLGPNGAGKSTLLKVMAGVLRPQSGRILLDDGSGPQGLGRRVGWMPQSILAVRGLTVHGQVAYAGWLAGLCSTEARPAAAQALDQVGLVADSDRSARSLSGGETRRLGLAEVLAPRPELLLLDEPTAGLDPAQRREFRRVLADLDPRGGIVVSTHEIADLDAMFDHVVVLVAGRILFDGPVEEFLGLHPGLDAESIFLALVGGGPP